MSNTPPQPRSSRHSLSTQTPTQPPSSSLRRALSHRTLTPRSSSTNFAADAEPQTPQAGPVRRLLARESSAQLRKPRKVRRDSLASRVADYPSNALISLQTNLALLSLDPLAYPAALALHALHALTRLPTFAAALPSWSDYLSFAKVTKGRYEGVVRAGDADARLEALRRGAEAGAGSGWAARMLLMVSVVLVLLSVANTAYLFTRRRAYHLVLRPDPLSSPNARSTKINFAPPRAAPSLLARLRHKFLLALPLSTYFYKPKHEEVKEFTVQRLDVWTPDHVKWSLVLFSLYPPPVALLWHLLSPSNFFLAALVGPLLVGQTFVLVRLYAGLVRDRHLLQSEVMHEYNAKFVNPRVFVQKRDAQTSTSDLDITQDPSYVPRLSSHSQPSLAPPTSHRLTKQPSLSHLREDRPAGWTPPGRVRRSTMGPAQVAATQQTEMVDTPVRQHRAAWAEGTEESEVAEEVHREAERQRRLAKRLGGEETPGSEARRRRRKTEAW